jgi:hypothetical protein
MVVRTQKWHPIDGDVVSYAIMQSEEPVTASPDNISMYMCAFSTLIHESATESEDSEALMIRMPTGSCYGLRYPLGRSRFPF